jgi:hypothetical protein
MATRICERCGGEFDRHAPVVRFCFPCTKQRDKDSGAYLAHQAVSAAVRRGDMPRASEFPCVDCAKPARDYDHRDYSKPLDVQPVCRSCNKLRGPAIPRLVGA